MTKSKRIVAWIACICIIAAIMPQGIAYLNGINWTWGKIVSAVENPVAPEATYRQLTVSSPIGPQKINAIEFNPKNPNTRMRAGLSKGKLYGVQTVLGMANDMNKKHPGQVVAAINADYFNFGEGVPFGIFMDEGEILSTPPQYSTAFGIKKDGTPFVVSHGSILNQILYIGDKKFVMTGINNPHRDQNSLVMYTDKYNGSTKAKKDSTEVVCSILSGQVKHGETLKLKVDSTHQNAGNTAICAGKIVLSAVGSHKNDLAYLKPGYEISVALNFNQFWSDVDFAIAGNRLLLENGQVQNNAGTERAPRTVIGTKPDGKVVFYTIDGRLSGYSVGATYKQAATIMRDLGCNSALNLDGGGSTTFILRPLGEKTHRMINRTADSSARAVANAAILLNTAPVGDAKSLFIKPTGRKVLVGGTYQYSISSAVDANYQPREVPSDIAWSVDPSKGNISATGVFSPTSAGMVQISASSSTASGVITTEAVQNITRIQSSNSSYNIKTNASQKIPVTVLRNNENIEFTNQALTWSVEGNIGKFSAPGVFVANRSAETGSIIVSYGNVTCRMPVTISGPQPEEFEKFKDMGTHRWAKPAVYRLFDAGIIRGVTDSAFAPAKPLKRADFMLMLLRLMKIDTSATPNSNFTDVPKNAYYYRELGIAKELGIAQGIGDNTFEPERNITRQEMFTLVWRVLKNEGVLAKDAQLSTVDMFTDSVNIAPFAAQAIATLTANKFIEGDAKGRAKPTAIATRADAAVFMDRIHTFMKK